MQNKQVKENNAERKRAMAKERSRSFREKKRLNVLKSVYHVAHSFHFCRVILSTNSFFFIFTDIEISFPAVFCRMSEMALEVASEYFTIKFCLLKWRSLPLELWGKTSVHGIFPVLLVSSKFPLCYPIWYFISYSFILFIPATTIARCP